MREKWVPLMEGYEVSDRGRVRSLPRRGRTKGRVLKPALTGRYAAVTLPGRTQVHIHKAVMEAFVGPKPSGAVIRHLDGDVWNNDVTNLAYGTPAENEQDKIRHGRNPWLNKDRCPQGHRYTPENTGFQGPNKTHRYCRQCARDRARKRRER